MSRKPFFLWFLKDHVTLKTGVMMLKIQLWSQEDVFFFYNIIKIILSCNIWSNKCSLGELIDFYQKHKKLLPASNFWTVIYEIWDHVIFRQHCMFWFLRTVPFWHCAVLAAYRLIHVRIPRILGIKPPVVTTETGEVQHRMLQKNTCVLRCLVLLQQEECGEKDSAG